MAIITITFLCDFVTKPEGDSRNKKKGKKDKKEKKSKNKKDKKIKDEPKIENVENDRLDVVVDIKNPLKYLHIEYNLIPQYGIYAIDVVSWGSVTKVYTKDGIKAMKTIKKDRHCWVAFTIEHIILLSQDELIALKSHTINFTMWSSKGKIGLSARTDKVKTFYFLQKDIDMESTFAEAYEDDPNIKKIQKVSPVSIVEDILNDLLNFPAKNDVINKLKIIPDETHCKKIKKTIENVSSENFINYLNSEDDIVDITEFITNKKGKKSKKQSKKKKKPAKNPPGVIKLQVPGEVMFTDPHDALFDFKQSSDDISRAFILIRVQKLMNREQIYALNPVVIKLEKIENLPSEILTKHRFSLLYAKYDIGDINYITGGRPISQEIYFKDHRVHFLKESALKLLAEQVQTGYLIIQLHGIRPNEPPKSNPKMFGRDLNDKYYGRNLQYFREIKKYTEEAEENSKKSVLLFLACFKLDALLNPFWTSSFKNYCLHPQHWYAQCLGKNDPFEKVTINTINININAFDQNPLTHEMLLTNGTSLKLEIQLCRPINTILSGLKLQNDIYNRIFLVIYNTCLAKSMLNYVLHQNQYWLGSDIILPNYLNKSWNIDTEAIQSIDLTNIITGFIIDAGNFYLMCLEGLTKGIIKFLWRQIKDESKNDVKVFYNSDYVFKNRIYSEFTTYGGVLIITLQQPFHLMLAHTKMYLRACGPKPCREALLKLDLLVRCKTEKEMALGLFPTARELISLNVEWGAPLHWRLNQK